MDGPLNAFVLDRILSSPTLDSGYPVLLQMLIENDIDGAKYHVIDTLSYGKETLYMLYPSSVTEESANHRGMIVSSTRIISYNSSQTILTGMEELSDSELKDAVVVPRYEGVFLRVYFVPYTPPEKLSWADIVDDTVVEPTFNVPALCAASDGGRWVVSIDRKIDAWASNWGNGTGSVGTMLESMFDCTFDEMFDRTSVYEFTLRSNLRPNILSEVSSPQLVVVDGVITDEMRNASDEIFLISTDVMVNSVENVIDRLTYAIDCGAPGIVIRLSNGEMRYVVSQVFLDIREIRGSQTNIELRWFELWCEENGGEKKLVKTALPSQCAIMSRISDGVNGQFVEEIRSKYERFITHGQRTPKAYHRLIMRLRRLYAKNKNPSNEQILAVARKMPAHTLYKIYSHLPKSTA